MPCHASLPACTCACSCAHACAWCVCCAVRVWSG
jgi:hypothetical protein